MTTPASKIRLVRTQGDTDPLLMRLTIRLDSGEEPIPDDATVTMNINLTTVEVVEGVPRGDQLGYFSFPVDVLDGVTDTDIEFEVEVARDGYHYTHVSSSHIVNRAEL